MSAKAMNQTQLNIQEHDVQTEYEAVRQKIAELETEQANLQRVLYRIDVHRHLVGKRTVPNYASWLPFSN